MQDCRSICTGSRCAIFQNCLCIWQRSILKRKCRDMESQVFVQFQVFVKEHHQNTNWYLCCRWCWVWMLPDLLSRDIHNLLNHSIHQGDTNKYADNKCDNERRQNIVQRLFSIRMDWSAEPSCLWGCDRCPDVSHQSSTGHRFVRKAHWSDNRWWHQIAM